jgi:hypothetical protein
MNSTSDPVLSLTLRPPERTTPLGERDKVPLIIHPAGDPAWAGLGAQLMRALAARGVAAECTTDLALIPERHIPLPDTARTRPLIVLGALGTNRVLQPHYANFLCATDAAYPGDTGWELRTLVDPYHTGANLILCGGGRVAGVAQAVARLGAEISTCPDGVVLPWLMQVQLDPALAAQFTAWPHTPLAAEAVKIPVTRGYFFFADLIRTVSMYTQMWWLTGDRRYAEVALTHYRALNDHVKTSYGDWHYLAERFLRALPLLAGGGWLTETELKRTYDLLLGTALASQNDWWRMRDGHPPFGHRHQGKGTYEFLVLARCLRDTAGPSPALRALCDRWITECTAFLDGLVRAEIDDQDDESTFNNIAQLFRYALGEERHEFFINGHARRAAARALALHDNMGSGAGQGGYGEGLSMYYQQEAATQVAGSAFYYGDGELKWIFQHLPRLARAQRFMPFQFTPTFVHQFEVGDELAPQPPRRFCGLTVLPATAHQYTLCTEPPVHLEPRGHLANALETWFVPEAVGLTQLTREQAFDKLVLRGGFEPTDPYLLLQGYQGGFRWQGHMQAANCIVRFAQAGHVWLVQNTLRHSPYDKNGLLLSDGPGITPQPPLAECVATADFAPATISVTRLPDCAQADWTRHLFWARDGSGWFVVIDRVNFKSAGQHSLTCTWRTPAWAALEGRRWHSLQGRHRFDLVAGDHVPATCEEETNQGASRPFVLRQRRTGQHEDGETTSFSNLFYVRPQEAGDVLDLQQLDEGSAVVRRDNRNLGWCSVALDANTPWLTGAAAVAESAWLNGSAVVLAGATEFSVPGLSFRSDLPAALCLDLAASTLSLNVPAHAKTTLTVNDDIVLGRGLRTPPPRNFPLSAAFVASLSRNLQTWLSSLHPSLTSPAAPAVAADPHWHTLWTQPAGPVVPERLRNVCITATPPPIDGIAQQLIDTIPPQSREIADQWPAAPHYDLTLRFAAPEAVESISLLGDSIEEPTLRTFAPLPDGITLETEDPDGTRQTGQLVEAPSRLYKRVYVDLAVTLQQRQAKLNCTVKALHVHCPAPADGRPFVLHEIELLGPRRVSPAVKHWLAADLDHDGRPEIVLCDSAGNLRVLDGQGCLLWEKPLALESTHLSIQPVDQGGAPAVCVGLIDGSLHAFSAKGEPVLNSPLATGLRAFTDRLMGIFYVVNSLTVWHRDESGRGWLVSGGYGLMLFLDGTGRILGHNWADGAWVSSLLTLPPGHPAAGDLYLRSGWNHGVGHYAAHAGPGPSGVVQSWGGFRQPMFRELKQVIPFVNGPSLAFEYVPRLGSPAGAIFAAAELGFGLLSLATHDWVWQHEVVNRLQAVALGQIDGEPAVMIGGADGFLNAFALADGRALCTHLAPAPVVGVSQRASGDLLVASRAGLEVLDANWQPHRTLTRPLRRMLALGGNKVLLTRQDHTLELVEYH